VSTHAYTTSASGVLYVVARPGGSATGTSSDAGRLRLLAILGAVGNGGGVAPRRLSTVHGQRAHELVNPADGNQPVS
jgi:hypothetical protein